jgi:hypothetical protein
MNKLGDRKYLDKDLSGARQLYAEALALRKESCCKSAQSASPVAEPALAEAQLGMVTSLLKVLDIEQVINHLALDTCNRDPRKQVHLQP